MAVSIFFDEYNNQAAGLEAIKGDAESIQQVLEDEQKFRYKFPSEDPTICEPHQFENQGRLVSTLKAFLEEWEKRQPRGTVMDSFLLYVHGHGAQVLGQQCLMTKKWTAIPIMELVNLVVKHVPSTRYYVIMDCCSNKKIADEKAMKRVAEAMDVEKPHNFKDKFVLVNAAPEGFTASAERGKTLSSALVRVLDESLKRGENGVPLRDLENRLREEQVKQGSSNFPTVVAPPKLMDELFPL